MAALDQEAGFHYSADTDFIGRNLADPLVPSTYNFENFFHPLVGKLIQKLNLTSVAGMLDPGF